MVSRILGFPLSIDLTNTAPAHYFASDYDLGGGPKRLSAGNDFAMLSQYCINNGIRLISDLVMGFGHDPYVQIDFRAFHIIPDRNEPDVDNYQSYRDGELRDTNGGSCWRYLRDKTTYQSYDPQSGQQANLKPARVFHRAHLAYWMSQFKLGGFRLDSLNNVADWNFIHEFHESAYEHFRTLYSTKGGSDDQFIVIGEELSTPLDMIQERKPCVDALWNEEFRRGLRAIVVGESYNNDTFAWTVKKTIDCTLLNIWNKRTQQNDSHFESGLQAVNYITSHDTAGDRHERLFNQLAFMGVAKNADKARRAKLAFACLLTSVGIPMIFAGEEFCDAMDRNEEGKQRDPVNWARKEDGWRIDLFKCVARLVRLRKTCPALQDLSKGSTKFIKEDISDTRRVMAWVRGRDPETKVVVVANFSDGTPSTTRYSIDGWPETPAGLKWFDVIDDSDAPNAGHEPLGPWDVKVYTLVEQKG